MENLEINSEMDENNDNQNLNNNHNRKVFFSFIAKYILDIILVAFNNIILLVDPAKSWVLCRDMDGFLVS